MTVNASAVTNSSADSETVSGSSESGDAMSWDDATWILTSSFIIFTMQSGTCSKCLLRHLIAADLTSCTCCGMLEGTDKQD